MNSSASKSSRYIERRKTKFMQQKYSKASDEFAVINVSDSDTEDEDTEKSAFRPIMIIRQGNAELKNTKKKYL